MNQKNGRDALFLKVLYILVGMVTIYMVGISALLLVVNPSDNTVVRFIASFGTVFAGLLGLCMGYLLGARNGNGK